MNSLVEVFLLFLKINFLTASGPASYGLTKQEVVPRYMDQNEFAKLVAIASGTPGSDAVQMAWQVGNKVGGLQGSIFAVFGALIPPISLLILLSVGLSFISVALMNKFINGIKPTLAILLVITAVDLLAKDFAINRTIIISIFSIILFYLKIPIYFILILSGFFSLLIK